MTIYPAIDIKGGKCVRLTQGDFNAETVFANDPSIVAQRFDACRAEFIHIVDLDGAKTGVPAITGIIKKIASSVNAKIQTGGGIRTLDAVKEKIDAGAARVILGTAAVRDMDFLAEAVRLYGNRIAVGIDARDGKVAVSGWLEDGGVEALALCKKIEALGVETVIYTDISRDGMLTGVNTEATAALISNTGLNVIASGGVSCMADLAAVKKTGVEGVIIGKAIYLGAIDLAHVIKRF